MLLPPLVAALFTFFLIVPSFISQEINHQTEDAGFLCILASLAVWIWYATTLVRSILMVAKTCSFKSSLERTAGAEKIAGQSGLAWMVPRGEPLLALVGLTSPRILITRTLLDSSTLDPKALQIAIHHEYAHARHHDNWKLLIARLLPQIPLRWPHLHSFEALWRRYSEWAADDEAVAGDPDRALLLAEGLLHFARSSCESLQGMIATELAGHDRELSMRIRRLLVEKQPAGVEARRQIPLSFAFFAFALPLGVTAGLFYSFPFLHLAAEYLLHLG
jgi:hypothetical protein